jgi:hypothetical protein
MMFDDEVEEFRKWRAFKLQQSPLEKSFEDLPTCDQHLQEKRISGEDIYGGIFLQMKRDKVSLPDGQEAVRESRGVSLKALDRGAAKQGVEVELDKAVLLWQELGERLLESFKQWAKRVLNERKVLGFNACE